MILQIPLNFFKKIIGQTDDDGTLNVRIMMRLKYLSNFWKALLMPLIKFEISLIPRNCVKSSFFVANQGTTFKIIDINLYVAVVTLSIQDNAKVLKQLKPDFKQIIYWNEYKSKETKYTQKPLLDSVIDLSFQGLNLLFELSFENKAR